MRTPETVRDEAAKQFAWGVDFAKRVDRGVAEAEADQELGLRLVDAALALPEGGLLDWSIYLPAELDPAERFGRSLRVLPFLCGALRLLDLEFAHATAGAVPRSAVRELLQGAEAVDFEGTELTAKTVHIQYRRLALG